jgi:hypothetical protein
MMRDYDHFASLFTEDGVWRMPRMNAEFVSREEIRAAIERLQGLWDYLAQTPHRGSIQLEGDTAVGRAYVSELGHRRDGSSHLTTPCTTTTISAPWTAGNSRSASIRSATSTPLRWPARRPTQRGRPLTRGPRTSLRRKEDGDHGSTETAQSDGRFP